MPSKDREENDVIEGPTRLTEVIATPLGESRDSTQPETGPPFTPPAEDLLEKRVEAYRLDLKEQSRAMAIASGLEFVPEKLVAQAHTSMDISNRPWRALLGILGGVIAGACLSNLLQMIGLEQKIPPLVGMALVVSLVAGTALIAVGVRTSGE